MNVEQPGQAVPDSAWFKSSYSSGAGGECVEVARGSEVVHVRDSKNKVGAALSVGAESWTRFVALATS
ncbi:DUF397 domain-containing protein [Streptomyces sp. NBC_01233]|uniref:DUF397 domain-containing protein n=1 Tax=Streptomyces sp. NBC_01233 TaxID=2903787 RepID=UPI002E14ABCE|nr:DUF397 domain-containing protein [Streptomyces sp. NBC_01233]